MMQCLLTPPSDIPSWTGGLQRFETVMLEIEILYTGVVLRGDEQVVHFLFKSSIKKKKIQIITEK